MNVSRRVCRGVPATILTAYAAVLPVPDAAGEGNLARLRVVIS